MVKSRWRFAGLGVAATVTLCCLQAGFGASVAAQTLQEELNLLVQNNPRIEEQRAALRRAQQDVNFNLSGYYPQVSVSASEGLNVTSNSTTRLTNSDNDILIFDTLGFEVRQNLYDGGAKFNNIDAARLTRDSIAYVLSSTVQQTMLQGITAYLNVLRLNELIRVARARELTIKEQLDLETERVERGAGIAVDVLQAKSRLQLAAEQRVDLEGQLRQAMAEYIRVFEMQPDVTQMRLEPSPEDIVPPSLDDAIYLGRNENPLIQARDYVVRGARAAIEAARAGYLPTIDLVGRIDHENNVSGVRNLSKEVSVLLELSWDVFNGFATDAVVAGAQETYLEQLAVGTRTRNDVDRAIRQSWTKLENTKERKELLLNAVAIAQEVFSARQKLRSAGKETSLNVLDAENEVFQAEQNLIRADYDARLATYELAAAMGILTPALMNLTTPVIPDMDLYLTDPNTLEYLEPDQDALSRRMRQQPPVIPDINPSRGKTAQVPEESPQTSTAKASPEPASASPEVLGPKSELVAPAEQPAELIVVQPEAAVAVSELPPASVMQSAPVMQIASPQPVSDVPAADTLGVWEQGAGDGFEVPGAYLFGNGGSQPPK